MTLVQKEFQFHLLVTLTQSQVRRGGEALRTTIKTKSIIKVQLLRSRKASRLPVADSGLFPGWSPLQDPGVDLVQYPGLTQSPGDYSAQLPGPNPHLLPYQQWASGLLCGLDSQGRQQHRHQIAHVECHLRPGSQAAADGERDSSPLGRHPKNLPGSHLNQVHISLASYDKVTHTSRRTPLQV